MKKSKQIVVGIIIGIVITVAWFTLKDSRATVYTVHSVQSHYPHKNANSQTTLVVYMKGETGHVMEVECGFPPGFRLTEEDRKGGWKVKVTNKVSEAFLLGEVYYCCERVK